VHLPSSRGLVVPLPIGSNWRELPAALLLHALLLLLWRAGQHVLQALHLRVPRHKLLMQGQVLVLQKCQAPVTRCGRVFSQHTEGVHMRKILRLVLTA
jgi:hypothetical protein